jgi:hypothetical protein
MFMVTAVEVKVREKLFMPLVKTKASVAEQVLKFVLWAT